MEDVKLSLFADIILHIEKSEDSTTTNSMLQNTKSHAKILEFLYKKNKISKKKIKKAIPYTISIKEKNHPRANITKGIKDFYKQNYKMLLFMKEI